MHECKYLVHIARHELGWNQGNNTRKDSTYASTICHKECQEDVIVKSILKRIELITGIPSANGEDVELRLYAYGAHKELGHDYQEHERDEPQGVRIATFYIFLTEGASNGDDSAAWQSPPLTATIQPKTGQALYWVNVQDGDLNEKEPRMEYKIDPANHSVQYALVIYFHQRNYKDTRDCPVTQF